MSRNIAQIYNVNPAVTLNSTDLFYLGRSPYGLTDDFATTWSTILSNIPGAVTNKITTTSDVNMVQNQNYILNTATACIFNLPAASAIGSVITVTCINAGKWRIKQASGQQIIIGTSTTTLGASGILEAVQQGDTVTIMCVTANTIWQVIAGVTADYLIT